MNSSAAKPSSIRWHLLEVLLVAIVPIGLLAGALLYLHWQAQERERERSQIQSVRLLADSVDNAIDSTIQRLNLFARQWAAGTPDAEMHARSVEAVASNPDWTNMVAFRADGSPSFRADARFGTPLPKMTNFAPWRPVVEQRRAVLSDVFTSRVSGKKLVGVGVPVIRNGEVTHVLIADLNLRWFDELLDRQGTKGVVAGLFDRNWKFVAHNLEGEERRGTDPSGPLVEDIWDDISAIVRCHIGAWKRGNGQFMQRGAARGG